MNRLPSITVSNYLRYIIVVLVISLFPLYVLAVNSLPSDVSSKDCGTSKTSEKRLGFCTDVSATVVRDYYYGTVQLKTTVLGVNIDALNKLIAPIIVFLASLTFKFLKKGSV